MWMLKLRRVAKQIGREALILAFALRDPATPLPLKAAAVAALAYVFSPVDLVPDLPLIGWVDDLLVLSFGVPYLVRKLPPAVYLRASAKAHRVLAALGVEPRATSARRAHGRDGAGTDTRTRTR